VRGGGSIAKSCIKWWFRFQPALAFSQFPHVPLFGNYLSRVLRSGSLGAHEEIGGMRVDSGGGGNGCRRCQAARYVLAQPRTLFSVTCKLHVAARLRDSLLKSISEESKYDTIPEESAAGPGFPQNKQNSCEEEEGMDGLLTLLRSVNLNTRSVSETMKQIGILYTAPALHILSSKNRMKGASALGCGTMLQARRTQVRFPMRSMYFSIYLVLPTALWSSVSNRNEYKKLVWGKRAPSEQGWQTHCHLWADFLENVAPLTSHSLLGFHGLLQR
jgi:hypothetical protein